MHNLIPHQMKIKATLFFFYVLSVTTAQSQSSAANLVKWDASRKINWNHFSVKDGSDRFAAECYTFFKASFYLENDSVFCEVITYLNTDSSWRKPSLKAGDGYNINHEQVHFDITEIFARKVRQELMENSVNEQQVKKIYQDNSKACRLFQERYDSETRHSLDKKKQAEWNAKIRSLLHQLGDYQEQAIFIPKPWCKPCWKDIPKTSITSK